MAKHIAIILLLVCATGCSKRTTEAMYIHTTDTVYRSRTLMDYLIERDTVNTYTRGDTVFRDVVKWRTRYVGKSDTVYESHTDTLWRDRERIVERKVERELNWWERVRMDGFWVLLGLIVLWVIWRRIK